MRKAVRWDDDTITNNHLHMRDVVKASDACNNERKAGWISMKFVMDIMPFEANPKSYSLISKNWQY
jgi:hypothetical protein